MKHRVRLLAVTTGVGCGHSVSPDVELGDHADLIVLAVVSGVTLHELAIHSLQDGL